MTVLLIPQHRKVYKKESQDACQFFFSAH